MAIHGTAHPHPNRYHILVHYRKFLLGFKRSNGTARGLVHYSDILEEYLEAKRDIVYLKLNNVVEYQRLKTEVLQPPKKLK